MTEDLRALLRAELNDERPPPLGDVVGAALRDGRRIQRRRRAGLVLAGSVGLVGFLLAGSVALVPGPRSDQLAAESVDELITPAAAPPEAPRAQAAAKAPVSPGSVPFGSAVPETLAPQRSLAIRSGTHDAAGTPTKATAGAMLYLLTKLLPAGAASKPATADTGPLSVEVILDRGAGPGTIRLELDQAATAGPRPARGDTATVTVADFPDDCTRSTTVTSRWPDGTTVRLEVGTCLALKSGDGPDGPPVLSQKEAILLASNPRWGLTMDPELVAVGDKQFGALPVPTP
ncbi:hypothetical protein [Actinoplanes solisilvae]|uniref:hypothetical protein n=1 Tax=Actinoplanes solisilvae TaxID=2486853 RepID=UPI000FDCD974|nr:hypothetical protein [Actinoplanes solisilvae]